MSGADGLLFVTADGGTSWAPLLSSVDDPAQRHLYVLAGNGRDVYVAGEQGFLARSDDGGRSFTRIHSPYDGTFFVATAFQHGGLFVAGLRGHAYVSSDRGDTFHD